MFGNKLVKPEEARDALVAPVRNAKLNVKRWLRACILSTLVFGLLSIAWHALNCHLWIQLLGMYRAFFRFHSEPPSRPAGKVRVRSGRPAMAPGAAVASFAGPWGACRRPRGP